MYVCICVCTHEHVRETVIHTALSVCTCYTDCMYVVFAVSIVLCRFVCVHTLMMFIHLASQ